MKTILLAMKKALVMFGGKPWLLPVTALALAVCFAAFSLAVSAKARSEASVAVYDACGGEYSEKLVSSLSSSQGFKVISVSSEREAYDLVLSADAEAVLTISHDYDDALTQASASDLVSIYTSPGSVTAELIRETLAGKIIAQRSYKGVKEDLACDGFDAASLDGFMEEYDAPTLYQVTGMKGGAADTAVFGQGFPGYEGFIGLALMLVMMTLSHRLSSQSSRLVGTRMLSLERGLALDLASDTAAVFGLCLIFCVPAFAFAPNKTLILAVSLICYSAAISALCVLLSRVVSSGRMDVASPFIAFVTSLFGGCFADISALSPALGVISKLTPQGQLTAAVHGTPVFASVLLLEAAVLAAFALIVSMRRRPKK